MKIILFAIAIVCTCYNHSAIAAQTLENAVKQWSYRISLDGIEVTTTLLTGDIIDRWADEENSTEVKSRIAQLRNAINQNGYTVALFHFRPEGSFFTYSLSPARENLYASTPQHGKEFAAFFSPSLDEPISFGQDYYGVAVFKMPNDAFAFPVVSAKLMRKAAPQIPCVSYQRDACTPKSIPLQFAFMPDGAPKKHRPRSYNSSNAPEILRFALSVLRFIRV